MCAILRDLAITVFLTALLLGWSPISCGQQLVLNLASQHHVAGDYNERNWGLGYEHDLAPGVLGAVGAYRNSFGDTSFYVGAGVRTGLNAYVRVGAFAVLVSGYADKLEYPVIAAPMVELGPRWAFLRVGHVPGTVTTLQAVYRFRE